MRLLAIIPMAVQGLVAAMVGVRLLRLGLRTRQLPELSLGIGLSCVGLLGMPLATVGRTPALIGTLLGDALFAAGVGISHAGLVLLFVFTWSVFRRTSSWARIAVAVAAASIAASAAGLMTVGLGSTDMAEIFPRTRPFAALSVGTVGLCFLWNAIESTRYARMLERRLALGLSDPVLTNRFQLWALAGWSTCAMCAVLGVCIAIGLPPLVEPVPAAIAAGMSAVSGATWYLSFLPPTRYLDSVRARAPRPD